MGDTGGGADAESRRRMRPSKGPPLQWPGPELTKGLSVTLDQVLVRGRRLRYPKAISSPGSLKMAVFKWAYQKHYICMPRGD